jgi:hypothetical protein
MILFDLITYLYLFFQIALSVTLGVILLNIYLKSYKPQNSVIIIAVITVIFILNLIIAMGSVNSLVNTIKSETTNTQTVINQF